jgi:NAD(P)-dependent dehydrogenase (short-subunit alcohol dehydrogenase family)
MKERKSGLIIHILTTAIIHNPSRMSSYIMAKAGLSGMTKALMTELKAFKGIRVVNISPSFVETDLIKAFPEKMMEMERQKQPDNKLIQPEDVSSIIMSVIDDGVTYPHGTDIIIEHRKDVQVSHRFKV